MTPLEDALILFLCLIAGCFAGYWMYSHQKITELKKKINEQENLSKEKLAIAAYERLLLFANRTAPKALITRLFNSELSAKEMQQQMTQAIRDEYDHNVTQQLYIKPAIWEAVGKMKEQNIYLINELGALLPENATALDLNKSLLQLLMQNEKATLNATICEAITYEVQKQLAEQTANA